MSNINLNLARKWRSKNFDQIVGQSLPIRMLKNSLYLGHYFPVYLFTGQHGCGKTTTARVFAAAVNCEQLENFRKNPQQSRVPCLKCVSCEAMLSSRHPDFIEIDAASHTGVDNVRQIIDAASLLPLMGRKKIYLIDEAHMLSKAAFNAFLKILEEPPSSVLFILATTDRQKIIDTVKSRSFQLFFKKVESQALLHHLMHICNQEDIAYEAKALELIIKETKGSARDAINLLEQVRFAHTKVSADTVQLVLGHLDDKRIIKLFSCLLNNGPNALFTFVQDNNIEQYSAEFLWRKLIQLTRTSLWLKHRVKIAEFKDYQRELEQLLQCCNWSRLVQILQIFYANEEIFLKTTDKYPFLEMILLQICQKNSSNDNSSPAVVSQPAPIEDERQHYEEAEQEEEWEEDEEEEQEDEEGIEAFVSDKKVVNGTNETTRWKKFVHEIDALNDPLLRSIFSQGTFLEFDENKKELTVEFSKEFIFFNDWLENTTSSWMPLLQRQFFPSVIFNPRFTGDSKELIKQKIKKENISGVSDRQSFSSAYTKRTLNKQSFAKKSKEKIIDVSDVARWKTANLLLRYFPGKIVESMSESR